MGVPETEFYRKTELVGDTNNTISISTYIKSFPDLDIQDQYQPEIKLHTSDLSGVFSMYMLHSEKC